MIELPFPSLKLRWLFILEPVHLSAVSAVFSKGSKDNTSLKILELAGYELLTMSSTLLRAFHIL